MTNSQSVKRKKKVRILAGPNGSGKSTVYKALVDRGFNLGPFVNADEIELELKTTAQLNITKYEIDIDLIDFIDKYKNHSFFDKSNKGDQTQRSLTVENNVIFCSRVDLIDSYFAAFIADYLRTKMLDCVSCFTVETVMSHESKLKYIKSARDKGYYVYLYFVSTSDVEINIERVLARVGSGGHNVPEDKIRKRYTASLALLASAVQLSYRTFVFDNSKARYELCAECGNGIIKLCRNDIPDWVNKYLLEAY